MGTTIENFSGAEIKCVAKLSSCRLCLCGGAKAVLDVLEESLQADDRKIKKTEETLGGFLFPELPIVLPKPKRTLTAELNLRGRKLTFRGDFGEALAEIRSALQPNDGSESTASRD